jgi:dUTP pyrophosphatase
VIDSGYRGEILVLLRNDSTVDFTVNAGDKIAQIVPIPVLTWGSTKIVDELWETSRGADGFGSTGK